MDTTVAMIGCSSSSIIFQDPHGHRSRRVARKIRHTRSPQSHEKSKDRLAQNHNSRDHAPAAMLILNQRPTKNEENFNCKTKLTRSSLTDGHACCPNSIFKHLVTMNRSAPSKMCGRIFRNSDGCRNSCSADSELFHTVWLRLEVSWDEQ
jgi:hypothetical protein